NGTSSRDGSTGGLRPPLAFYTFACRRLRAPTPRRYPRPDMTTEADYKPGLEDVPAAKSAVSFLDGKKAVLEYRGIPVEVLAKESSFEEVSWLLIKGSLPSQKELADFDHGLRQRRAIHYRMKDLIKCMPPDGHPMDALHASVAALGMFYPCPTVFAAG